MTLLIDNYDSFSYNLYQMIGAISEDIKVVRNDAVTVSEVDRMHPDRILLSPGPGHPKDAGILEGVVRLLHNKYPILGVCLGHQGICEALGGKVVHAKQLMHGKASDVILSDDALFRGIPKETRVARYHSLTVEEASLPEALQVIAKTPDGEVMAVRHRVYPVYGVQFHPESILTPCGNQMLKNFMRTGA